MKYSTLFLFFFISPFATAFAQQRYVDEVFSQVQVTPNITYGQNFSILLGFPLLLNLVMDVYEPAGDTLAVRSLIVYMHPGDFLPILFNNRPTGDLHDSAVVEMCKQFAQRGYVVANMDYRLGWNPVSTDSSIRTGTLVQAFYRGLQDAKTCVRYFKMNAGQQGNTYKVDVNRIVVGGQGSAGFIATAYAALNDTSELQIPQFISPVNDPYYGIVAGESYINPTVMGDFGGLGGDSLKNNSNWTGYSSDINMVFNLEGDLVDSSWIQAGEVPMAALHDVNDPLFPFLSDSLSLSFIAVAGSHNFIRYANTLGNNDVLHITWTDPYSLRANYVNGGAPWEYEGLFPVVQPDPSLLISGDPFHGQSGPWEWWDSTDLISAALLMGLDSAQADSVYHLSLLTNPDMAKSKALRYIDTAQHFLAERICLALGLCQNVGIDEMNFSGDVMNVFPNPAPEVVHLKLADASSHFLAIKIFDVEGRKVFDEQDIYKNSLEVSCNALGNGFLIIKVLTEKGMVLGKLVIE